MSVENQQGVQQETPTQTRRKEQETNAAKSKALLPILNAANERYVAKIDLLQEKKAVRLDKLARNEKKIQRLTEKADRLAATNDMLKAITAGTILSAPISAMIEKNQKRIDKIQTIKVPKCEKKIAAHKERIAVLDRKIEVQKYKSDKCKALSGVITSFAVMNPEKRRAQFAQSMNLLHGAALGLNHAKVDKVDQKITALEQQYEQSNSAVEQLRLTRRLETLHAERMNLREKCQKLMPPPQYSTYQAPSTEQQDALQTHAEQQLDAAVQHDEVQINPLTENLCTEMVSDMEVFAAQDRIAALDEAMTDFNSAVDHITSQDTIKSDSAIISDVANPKNHIVVTASHNGQHVVHDYTIYKNGEKQNKLSDQHTTDADGHVVHDASEKASWSALKNTMLKESSINAQKVLLFTSQEKYKQYCADLKLVQKENRVAEATVQTDKQAIPEKDAHKEQQKQVIHPEVYAQMSEEDRFTRRMPEAEARQAVAELQKKGIQHSAVFDGQKSGVTISKADEKQEGFFLGRAKRDSVRRDAAEATKKETPTQGADTPKHSNDAPGL